MFEILLNNEQEQMLVVLVEAVRNVAKDQRQKFFVAQSLGGSSILHPGLPGQCLEAYDGDFEALAQQGLLLLSHGSSGTLMFDVTPQGFKYYEQIKHHAAQPLQRIETTIREYLDAERFRQTYSMAYQKWTKAEEMLWASDSEHQLTVIGHLCREALQEFARVLVEQYQLLNVDKDKAHTVKRIKAVLDLKKEQVGNTEKPFLEALLAYWGTVNDLIQRQEHGGQKEGQPLVWEDGRRVVFQTAIVMFEIDKSISRTC